MKPDKENQEQFINTKDILRFTNNCGCESDGKSLNDDRYIRKHIATT